MDIIEVARGRHTCKAYDPNRKISSEDMSKVRELLRLAPSSVNGQPWHFLIVSSEEARKKVVGATTGNFVFNSQVLRDASHIVVFCGYRDLDSEYLEKLLQSDEKSGRFDADDVAVGRERKQQMKAARQGYTSFRRDVAQDIDQWIRAQVYINLGQFLLGVAALGMDATPMEGFDAEVVDREFGLSQKGLRSMLLVPIGYRDPERDYNAALPKARLSEETIIEEI